MRTVNRLVVLRVFMWTIGIYHVLLGAIPFLPRRAAVRAAGVLFGLDIAVSGQMACMARLFGAYAAIFGLLMGAMASDPVKYRRLIRLAACLFILRFVDNVVMFEEMRLSFRVPAAYLLKCLFFLGLMAAALLTMTPRGGDRESVR